MSAKPRIASKAVVLEERLPKGPRWKGTRSRQKKPTSSSGSAHPFGRSRMRIWHRCRRQSFSAVAHSGSYPFFAVFSEGKARSQPEALPCNASCRQGLRCSAICDVSFAVAG
ncbi:hypothetical protein MRX96_009254 [Rhipicephalus microplus]